MNWQSIVVLIVILSAVVVAVWICIKNRKKGGCCGCSQGCNSCGKIADKVKNTDIKQK